MLMLGTPVLVHVKSHTHRKGKTHMVLRGRTHVFVADGKQLAIEQGGFLRLPGATVHEA